MGMDAGPIYAGQVEELDGPTGIKTADYQEKHSDGTTSLGSWNWGCVSVALDSIRARLKRAAIWTLMQSFTWFSAWLSKQIDPKHGHGGQELRSGIYMRFMVRSVRVMRALAIGSLVDLCNRWLRHYLFFTALHTIRGRGRWMTTTQLQANGLPKGPGVFVANAPPGNGSAPITSAGSIKRSWSRDRTGTIKFLYRSLADRDLAEAIRLKGFVVDEVGAALRKHGLDSSWPITPEEIADINACIDGDPEAFVRVFDLLSATGYPCGDRVRLVRYGATAALVVLERMPGQSSTAPAIATLSERQADGTVRVSVMVVDSGGRDTGANDDDVDASRAIVNLDVGKVVAVRDDGKGGPVRMIVPTRNRVTGEILFDEFGDTLILPSVVLPAPSPPPVVNAPQVTIDDSFFERIQKCLDDFLARIRARIGA